MESPWSTTANNQIISSQNGLKKAHGKYVLNMRSDMILTGASFIDYFIKYNEDGGGKFFRKRIVVLPTYNPRSPTKYLFNICDWFFFGLTEDVKNLFDIPLMDEGKLVGGKINGHYPREENFAALEQYLWINFLKKYTKINFLTPNYFTAKAIAASEESYAQNTILVPAHRAKVMCLRMPHAGYGAYPMLSHGLYTFNEYEEMYNQYNTHKITYIPNPIEDLVYFILLRFRLFIKNTNPDLYKKVVNFIRKHNESPDLLK